MPVRRQAPVFVPRASYYNATPVHHYDHGIDDSISRAEYFSNAVLEDQYDAATRSRGRDHELLRNANAAIISTEQHLTPRSAAVSRRVRASSVPPTLRRVPAKPTRNVKISSVTKVVEDGPSTAHHHARPVLIYLAPASPNHSSSTFNVNTTASKPVVLSMGEGPWRNNARAGSLPPMVYFESPSPGPIPRRNKPHQAPVLNIADTTKLHAHLPPINLRARARSLEPPRRNKMYLYENVFEEPSIRPQVKPWIHRPIHQMQGVDVTKTRTRGRTSAPRHFVRAVSEPRNLEKASDYYHKIPDVKVARRVYAQRGIMAKQMAPVQMAPKLYLPPPSPRTRRGPSNKSKAAIIGSRMEAEDGGRYKRPHSQFAANKLRELKIQDMERRYN